jgi:hypothetical protein
MHTCAASEPGFIAYEYRDGAQVNYSAKPRLMHNAERDKPARVPVAWLRANKEVSIER